MLINNLLLYEKAHLISAGNYTDSVYYYFDYDERSYDINMEFQHFHNFYEIHIFLDSFANQIIEGKLYHIQLFDIVCLKPYKLHKSEYPPGLPRKRLIIQFNVSAYGKVLQNELHEVMSIFESAIPIYRFDLKYQEMLFHILNDIFQLSKSKGTISTLFIHSKLIEFLCTIFNYRKCNLYEPECLNTTTSKIYSIASFIHSHYSEALSLNFLAKQFFVSNYYLSHLFKEVTGFTLINYIQMTRIRNAQQLLLYTDKKISDISGLCGFNSFSQFDRVFQKLCHTSPRDYRLNAADDAANNYTIPTIYTND
jgi:AraC-like DNA-binding protein